MLSVFILQIVNGKWQIKGHYVPIDNNPYLKQSTVIFILIFKEESDVYYTAYK